MRVAKILAALAISMMAAAEPDLTPVAGQWRGPWYLGMTSGVLTLSIPAQGSAPATIQLTNHEKFGAEPVNLSEIELNGKALRFKAIGADGGALRATLEIFADGQSMKGFASHAGFNIRLEPSRVK